MPPTPSDPAPPSPPAPHGRPLLVVLTGAECTGKTTLAARLAAHYGTVWLPEYVRTFVEAKGAPVSFEDVPALARGHLDAAATLGAARRHVVFLDTDLVSTCVYSRHYFGACPAVVERLSHAHHADLYLLADTDIAWEPDPSQRGDPAERPLLHRRFREALERRALPYVLLSGPLDTRLATAVAAVDARLRGSAKDEVRSAK